MPCTVKLGIAPFPSLISAFYCSSSCLERMPHEGRKNIFRAMSRWVPITGIPVYSPNNLAGFAPCWSNPDNWSTLPERIQDRLFCPILWWIQTPLGSPPRKVIIFLHCHKAKGNITGKFPERECREGRTWFGKSFGFAFFDAKFLSCFKFVEMNSSLVTSNNCLIGLN